VLNWHLPPFVLPALCFFGQLLDSPQGQFDNEIKIKDGAENLLHVFSQSGASGSVDSGSVQQLGLMGGRDQLRKQVQDELEVAEAKIARIQEQIDVVMRRSEWIVSRKGEAGRERERGKPFADKKLLRCSGVAGRQHKSGQTGQFAGLATEPRTLSPSLVCQGTGR
jgi:hypothetical protein